MKVRDLFTTIRTEGGLLPMVHHFDHRWATYDDLVSRDVTIAEKINPAFRVLPRYWVPADAFPKYGTFCASQVDFKRGRHRTAIQGHL